MVFVLFNSQTLFFGFVFPFLFFFLYWWNKTARFRKIINKLPKGPRPLPIVGNALQLLAQKNYLEVVQIHWPRDYGEIFAFYVGPTCRVCISSPELMEVFLSSQKLINKGDTYKIISPWLGEGLLISSGAKWKSRRRMITPAFHFQILDDFMQVFNAQSRILCDLLKKKCSAEDNKSPKGGFDMFPFILNCTLDVICEAAMGIEVKAQTRESDYIKAGHRMNRLALERFGKPWLANDTIFSLTPTGREQQKLLRILHGFTEDVIHKRKEHLLKEKSAKLTENTGEPYPDGNKKKRTALLDLLLNVMLNSKDSGLTHKDIREEIDTFMFEGHDTTTSAITWFLYLIGTHIECQDRIFEELREIFGDDPDTKFRDCTQEDLNKLSFLDCCIKEALRLYPSVYFIERSAIEDVQVGKHLIPEGANVMLMIYAMHRNPRVYPDPLVFNPERFFPDANNDRHPFAYIPFSAGPRNCIGQRFAIMEMKVLIATLLRRFKFISSSKMSPIPSFEIVLKPPNGAPMIVTPRT